MSEVLHVELREQIGTAATRRLRKAGHTPVVLYGHGQDNVHLSVSTSEVAALVRHHGKTVQLMGAASDHALVKDMQFDPLGIEVLHLDLTRVDLTEKVVVAVPVRLHGEAVGTHHGGILLENVHEVQIRCSVSAIPENVGLGINDLDVGQSLTADKIELPEGAELVTAADTIICHCEPANRGAAVEAASSEGEPEVIGKKEE